MREVFGALVFGAIVMALWARGRRRPVSEPVYNLWEPPKRPRRARMARMKHKRWTGEELLQELEAAWQEEQKK